MTVEVLGSGRFDSRMRSYTSHGKLGDTTIRALMARRSGWGDEQKNVLELVHGLELSEAISQIRRKTRKCQPLAVRAGDTANTSLCCLTQPFCIISAARSVESEQRTHELIRSRVKRQQFALNAVYVEFADIWRR